jgi:hypothetical protein
MQLHSKFGLGEWDDPSMRNLLEISSVAQSLDGSRLTGSLPFPAALNLTALKLVGKSQFYVFPSVVASPCCGATLFIFTKV